MNYDERANLINSLSEAVNTNFFLFSSNLIPASTGIKFLVEIAFDTLLMASNNISFLIVNFIFIPSFLLFYESRDEDTG
mgnify:CR=1 FL=1